MKLRNEPYKDLLRYTNKRICNFNSTVASTRRKINPVTSEEIKLALGILILAKA